MTYIDKAAKTAMALYLRRCQSGGMPKREAETVMGHVVNAADLNYFAVAVAAALEEQGCKVVETTGKLRNQTPGNPQKTAVSNDGS